MAFDLSTAKSVAAPKFDLSTAKPVDAGWNVVSHTPDPWAVVSHVPVGAAPTDSPLKQALMSPVGAAEEFLKAGSGALASIPAGLAYGGAAVAKAAGADVNPSDVQNKVKSALTYQPVSNSGQAADQAFADTYGPVGKTIADKADKVATAVGKVSPTAEAALREAPAAASAAGAIVPAASAVRAAAGEISAANAAARANRPWQDAGFRTADDHPIARNIAGQSGKEALTLHNLPVGNTIAGNEAGVAAGQPVNAASLKAGRAAPNSVYDRVANGLPASSLAADKDTVADIKAAGSPKGGRITTGTPAAQAQIEKLRAELLDPEREFDGQQVVNELRGLRQEAGVNAASDDVSNQQLGNAQHDMADAIEAHIGRNIPKDGDVSLEQFTGARRALAKNFTVQGALRGQYVDPQALARVHANNPGLLDGGLQTYAQFAADHPEVASLPSPGTRYNPPGLARDLTDIDLKKPITYPQPLFGAAARRVLTGSPATAQGQANAAFPPRSPQAFAPIPPPPPPRIAGLLPSPAMVNAGSGVTTPGALDNLGLTPDVQAAAAAHPGAPRLGALQRSEPAPNPMASVDFQEPQNWDGARTTMHPGMVVQEQLSHRPMSLSPEDSWFKTDNRDRLKDYANVMRQGVPDGAMSRTAPRTLLANNASGESAASMEAISRGTKPLAVIDPDGNAQPLLRDVTQVDRTAPKGHLIIDTTTGEIIDRGGLTQAAANGLRNRWARLRGSEQAPLSLETPEQTRQRLLARALRDSQ